MKNAGEILKELLISSRKIAIFIETHVCDYRLNTENLRGIYAISLYYTCLDRHRAIILLIDRHFCGPALILVRPMLESWIRGTWSMSVPSEEQLDNIITMDNQFWKSKPLDVLADEVNMKNDSIGKVMKTVLYNVKQYLHDCIHSNNTHLSRYFNEQTGMIEPNFPDHEMALMLDLVNTIALSSAHRIQSTLTQDMDLLRPFDEELNNYQTYSLDLLKRLNP